GESSLMLYLSPAVPTPEVSANLAVGAAPLSTITQVLPLHYASLDEIAALFSPSALHGGRSFQTTSILSQAPLSGGGGQSFGGTLPGGSLSLDMRDQLGAERISDNVAIDRRLNAVIVTGTPDQVAPIVAEIRAVDRPDARQTSVQLDAKIFELTSSGARQVGINFAQNGPFATATLLSQTLQKPQIAATFQAQLFALIQEGKGTLISSPRLRTLNGTEASILTGDALPVVTTITYPGNPPTVQEQLQYVNVGVHLQVRPYVSSSGYVTSVVLAEVSNVTGFIQGNIPQISQRQAIATVRVKDGEPFVIGGLLQNNDITSISRVPLLSRIPIIGDLFKLASTTHEVTNLYVVITPHIVTSASAP
ncbi:MAG TPA: type II and III secretion system protein, partial [Candidatus Dormibacteraeota bacterium]|nr:type II and III secretion system protein [Candidatus Dormibacteraeota bacterium]